MKKIVTFILVFFGLILILFFTNVMWKSPAFYKTETQYTLEVPVMDMTTYKTIINTHRRPYIYTVYGKNKGKVIVVGVEHINDPSNAQFDSIRHYWAINKPDVALVEGRLGFLFKWFQDPIEHYGESGLTSALAKKDHVNLFTWEPTREDEIELMIKRYPAEKLAMFYALRPFYGLSKEERQNNPEDALQKLIDERTDYDHLRHTITSWQDVDSIWQTDFPNKDWRHHDAGYGWPGYLQEIWNGSNLSRDEHMIQIILEQVNQGKTVFVTMGSSHAPRIENTLKTALK
ncbi:hypothetical protein [uncultured Psychroserpens sp.]|uniref:hypothetical protein n=1 Tax=uncultured Psychroserpens sp. TaxID=255436 RepID=UPI002616E5BB|nr:hypothetical protein [uncultured Psychroserpens sp.]